jgi:hypothetical protein
MSSRMMLRSLALAASFALAGCIAQGPEPGNVGTVEQDVHAGAASAPADPNAPASNSDETALSAEPGALPGCNACGHPVPWTPPHDAPEAKRAPVHHEPANE